MSLRWLHLSDIHEAVRDGVNRVRMYDQILAEVELRDRPDVVFLTGDVAFAGEESEYHSLERSFIEPLKALVGADCPLFVVPGNHDLDRRRAVPPRSWINLERERHTFQAVDANGRLKRRDVLMPRFTAYADFDERVSAWSTRWLESDAGAAVWTGDINGHRIGVVGLNTAWLCQDDEDWGRISPGRYMVERALDEAAQHKPDLLIALGHHPLEAFAVEHAPEDGARIRRRLQQRNALYLHGHLHRTGSDQTGAGSRSALTVQAPSAFQAHDGGDRWRNGLLWVDVDFAEGRLILEPRRWNEELLEYTLDTDIFYADQRIEGREAYGLDLPSRSSSGAAERKDVDAFEAPEGWEVLNAAAIAQMRDRQPSEQEMIAFFDGLLPTWRLVLARGVEHREITQSLSAAFRTAFEGAAKPLTVVLLGAGGEGKSTAALQAGATLVESDEQRWTLLRRHSAAASFPPDLISGLPRIDGHAWLVMVDDADVVAGEALAAVRKLSPRTDVHLLLTARSADWTSAAPVPGDWQKAVDYRPRTLSGLSEQDAGRIVRGWLAWGDHAMGVLQGHGEKEAVDALLGHARKLATRKDGELLGALLVTRLGEDMRAHVRTLLAGLSNDHVLNGASLRDAYAAIACMHAENQLYLSMPVLAAALQDEHSELERAVLRPLQQEAMLERGQATLLTRHRLIAEAACQVLREDGYDLDRWYLALARAACRMALQHREAPGLAQWRFSLARHFVKKGEPYWPLARRIAKTVLDADPANVHTLTACSSVLRDTHRVKDALNILKANGGAMRSQRSFLKEWSTVAGLLGDDGLSCWLAGCSMADGADLDELRVRLALGGLAISFQKLFEVKRDPVYARAQGACGQLGVAMSGTGTGQGHFTWHLSEARGNGVPKMEIGAAMSTIRIGIVKGALEAVDEPDRIEALIGDPEIYRYDQAQALVGAAARRLAEKARTA